MFQFKSSLDFLSTRGRWRTMRIGIVVCALLGFVVSTQANGGKLYIFSHLAKKPDCMLHEVLTYIRCEQFYPVLDGVALYIVTMCPIPVPSQAWERKARVSSKKRSARKMFKNKNKHNIPYYCRFSCLKNYSSKDKKIEQLRSLFPTCPMLYSR